MRTYNKKDKILWSIFTFILFVIFTVIIIKKYELIKAITFIIIILFILIITSYIIFFEDINKIRLNRIQKEIVSKVKINAFEEMLLLFINNKFEKKFLRRIQNLRYLEAKISLVGRAKIIIKGSIKDFDCKIIIENSLILIKNKLNNHKYYHLKKINPKFTSKNLFKLCDKMLINKKIQYNSSFYDLNESLNYVIEIIELNINNLRDLYKVS